MDVSEYCRDLETYLCRKNDGHLVRIVGPSFEVVSKWAAEGVPLKVAMSGIDRYFERYYRKGTRRRPVKIDFCEADVLDVFDEWRRAVGVPTVAPDAADADATRRRASLPAHLDRIIARLRALRAGEARALDDVLEAIVRELDIARSGAKSIRGEARDRLVHRLRSLEGELLQAARERIAPDLLTDIEREAEAELAPFRERMPPEAYQRSRQACMDRIIRERAKLPVLAFE